MNVTVSTSTNPIEAHIIRGRLEAEGIPAFVIFEYHIWANWAISNAIGGVRVQVPSEFSKQAKTVIENINKGSYELSLEEVSTPAPTCCPKCNSQKIVSNDGFWKVALVIVFIFCIPLPYSRYRMRCTQCSNTWVAVEQRGYPIYFPFIAAVVLLAIGFALYSVFEHWCKLNCEYPL